MTSQQSHRKDEHVSLAENFISPLKIVALIRFESFIKVYLN